MAVGSIDQIGNPLAHPFQAVVRGLGDWVGRSVKGSCVV